VLTLTVLVRLRRCQVDDAARALWAMFVVLIPWLGALEFFTPLSLLGEFPADLCPGGR
jgi:hypothetical protein